MQNCHTSGKIPNISRTVSPIVTRLAVNDSAHIGLCDDILYKPSSKNCFCLLLVLEELQTRYSNRVILELENSANTATKELVGCGKNAHLTTSRSAQKVEPPPES